MLGHMLESAKPRALIFRLLGFLSLRNAQTIEPTNAWTAVSFPSASTRYSFLHLSGVWRTLWANRAGPNDQFQRTGPPSSQCELNPNHGIIILMCNISSSRSESSLTSSTPTSSTVWLIIQTITGVFVPLYLIITYKVMLATSPLHHFIECLMT